MLMQGITYNTMMALVVGTIMLLAVFYARTVSVSGDLAFVAGLIIVLGQKHPGSGAQLDTTPVPAPQSSIMWA